VSFLRSRMRAHSGILSKRGGGPLFICSTEILTVEVSCDRLWPARAPTLAGDLNFRSQRSEDGWPKPAWGLAKASPFLGWPAGVAGFSRPGRLKPVVWLAKAGLLLWWPTSSPTLANLADLKPTWESALASEACEDRFCGDLSTSQLQRLFDCVPLGSTACLRLK
jgi:hypothetical protein